MFSCIAAARRTIQVPQRKPTKFDKMVHRIFDRNASQDEVLVTIPDHPLTRAQLGCLAGQKWLTDDVLDAYMALLQIRATEQNKKHKFLPTHFYQVISSVPYNIRNGMQYVKEQDLFTWSDAYIPINVGGVHWVMVVVDFKSQEILSIDPLNAEALVEPMRIVARFLNDLASLRKISTSTHVLSWKRTTVTDHPVQQDGYNCGIYVLLYAEQLSRPTDMAIDPLTLRHMRQRIVVDLVSNNIVRPF